MIVAMATLAWCVCTVHGEAHSNALRQSALRPDVADLAQYGRTQSTRDRFAADGGALQAGAPRMQVADSDTTNQVGGPSVMTDDGIEGGSEPPTQESQQVAPRAIEADTADGSATAEQDATEEKSTGDEAEEEDADAEEDAEVEDSEEEEE